MSLHLGSDIHLSCSIGLTDQPCSVKGHSLYKDVKIRRQASLEAILAVVGCDQLAITVVI